MQTCIAYQYTQHQDHCINNILQSWEAEEKLCQSNRLRFKIYHWHYVSHGLVKHLSQPCIVVASPESWDVLCWFSLGSNQGTMTPRSVDIIYK